MLRPDAHASTVIVSELAMNLIEEFKTPEVQWQINKNFRLAREFIREYLAIRN